MKNLETLINELCPEGVEFVKFKDCCDYVRGITYNKSKEVFDDNTPAWNVLRANNITLSNNHLNFDDVKRVSKEVKVKSTQMLKNGDILICAGSGSKDHIGKVAYIEKNLEYTFGGFMAVIRSTKINTRFLFHILTGNSFKQYLSLALNSSTINNLNSSVMGNFEFPLPPIEVQTEIVRILDKFTELEAELEAELDCRRRQYEYYRDKLLSFENVGGQDVEWKKMSEVCKIMNGKDYKHLPNGDIPVYGSGGIMTHINEYAYNKPSVLIPRKGSIGNLFYVDEPFWTVDTIYWTKINENVIRPKFLYYFMTTKDLTKMNMAAGVPSLTQSMLNKIKLPIPPLAEQERIVSILDRFESLTTSLTAGLPAEIAARRQQYEHYRDQLLTFKRKSA